MDLDYASIIIGILSLLADLYLFIFYNEEQSLYSKLLKMISLFEISFIHTKIYIEFKDYINKFSTKIIQFISIKEISINYDNLKVSFLAVYIFLNIILFIETILLITRPFSQSKKKAKLYFFLSTLLMIIYYIILGNISGDDLIKKINNYLYIAFISTAVISILFVIKRFCWNKPLIQGAKNLFVLRHIIYIVVLSGILALEFEYVTFGMKEDIIKYIIYGLGLIMSIIKISDNFFVKSSNKNKNKKTAASMISSNLNVEFMCCILYGMTDIFVKNKNLNLENLSSQKEEIIHTINYINTISSSNIKNITEIQLNVSIDDLGSVLIPDQKNEDNDNEKKEFIIEKSKTKGKDALIIEYQPKIFNDLRKNDKIDDDTMIKAFSPSKNKSAIDKMTESKGKSGSFFFYSHDRKFIIKTINEEERATLLNILNDYNNYMNKETLITKLYGIYTVVIKNASLVNIVLMQNLFGCSPVHIQRMFDLKGSEVQRKTKNVQNWKRDQVLKDLDYQWLTKIEPKLINFKEDDIREIKQNLKNDIIFFKRLKLMDYSLLFIIIDFPNNIDPDYNQITGLLKDPKYRGHVYKSNDDKFLYIIGIIDYLQKYNFKKKMEHFFKGLYYGKEKNMVSAVEPNYYGDRFEDFMKKKVFIVGEKNLI